MNNSAKAGRKKVIRLVVPQCYCPTIVWIDGEPYEEKTEIHQQANGVVIVDRKIYSPLQFTEEAL